jgi:hypothetical protein
MKKKLLKKGVSVLLVTAMLFSMTGCSKLMNALQNANQMTSQITGSEEVPSGDWEKPEEPKHVNPEFQKGYCVEFDGKYLFRTYDDSSINFTGLQGSFQFNQELFGTNQIVAFDPANPEEGIKPFCADQGNGMMYLVGNDLYSERNTFDEGKTIVYRRTLPDGDVEDIIDGNIRLFSDDGFHFVTVHYDMNNDYKEVYTVYETGNEVTKICEISSDSDKYLYPIGMDESYVYMLLESSIEDGKYQLYMYDFDGNKYYLGNVDMNVGDYPSNVNEIRKDGDKVEFDIHIYQGTGHFYAYSFKVEFNIPTDLTPNNDTPASKVTVSEYTLDTDPQYTMPENLTDLEVYAGDESGFCKTLQYYTEMPEGTFYTMATAFRNPGEDIGWRWAYSFLNLHYCFLPKSGEPVCLNKMYSPGGSLGSLSEMENAMDDQAPTIYAFLQFIGQPGDTPKIACFQVAGINGPEVPIEYYNFYAAYFSEDFIWEQPEDDGFEVWKTYNFKEFVDMQKTNKYIYRSESPAFSGDGYLPESEDENLDFENSLCVHIGFDEEGKIDYMRPVIMD